MAIDKKLQIFDDEGNPVDYDILASDVKFNDGKDLPTKLAEMEEGIGEGTVKGVKMNNGSPIEPDGDGVVDLGTVITQHQDISGKVDKVTGKGLSKNDYTDADKTLVETIPSKANDADVVKSVSVNGTAQPKGTNGNVNVVVPTMTLDDVPTAGSNNAVKSGGIKTAIDQVTPTIDANGKWVIGGVTTDKDAQGPRGNTVLVNENAQGIQALIVNNVSDGGETDILSAEMGKVIRQNIMRIFNALGTYAFPKGKPVLSWGSTVFHYSINTDGVTGGLTISDVEVDGTSAGSLPSQIADGKSLSLKLNLPSNLYIYDAVAITMGGVDITDTTGVWDESTGEINIAAVMDDVVITATALTYVGYGEQNSPLVLMFDGMNQGETAGQWKDLANTSRSVALTGGYTKNSDNVQFDGTGYGSGNFVDDVVYNQSTVECVINQSNKTTPSSQIILLPGKTGAPALGMFTVNQNKDWITHVKAANDTYTASRSVYYWTGVSNTKYSVSYYGNTMIQNGQKLTAAFVNSYVEDAFNVNNHKDKTFVGAQITGANDILGFNGKIYCVRMYSRVLTDAEALQNWKVDQKRFNIS